MNLGKRSLPLLHGIQIFSFVAVAFTVAISSTSVLHAQKAAIGFNDLVAEVGAGLEDGTGIDVSQVEANVGNQNDMNPDNDWLYLPNPALGEFSGKTIIDGSGLSTGPSGHASVVGRFIYGNASSIAPGVTQITGYEANHWLNSVLGFAGNMDPSPQNFRVSNHSWVARSTSGITVSQAEDILRRVDYVVNENSMTVVVGADNNSANPLPRLLTQGYNSISVGRTDGNHSFGQTTLYGNGRWKPDIVAPLATTSTATGLVSSAAALLHEKADNQFGPSSDAAQPEVIKAALMAGATKQEFPSWDRTTTRPLDEQFGAGELNIYNSYFIVEGGEFDGQAVGFGVAAGEMGWDYGENIAGETSLLYDFDLGDFQASDFSLLLTWNMQVTDLDAGPNFDPLTQLADLQLRLYDSTSGLMNLLVDESISAVDNVEHLYFENLGSGRYTVEIENASLFATDFGFAWRFNAVPEPTGALLIASIVGIAFTRRRRR